MEKQKVRTNQKLNNRKASLKTLLVMLFLVLTSFASQAQWSNNPLLNTAICTATGNQTQTKLVSDGAGGAIVVWMDFRNGNDDIYAQRINAAGVLQWAATGVAIATANGHQLFPVVVTDGAGGAIIAWQDEKSGNLDIYAQRINAAGVVQWATDGVAICTAASNQTYPTIVSNGAGGAIIAWDDYRNGTPDIYAQRINAAGVVQWTANGIAICTATDYQYFSRIITDGSGGAIITWQDYRNGNYDIYAQRLNSAGVVQWTANGVTICIATGNQYNPTLVADGSGGAIIAWDDVRNGVTSDIYTQRITTAGAVQWIANGVAICAAIESQSQSKITADGVGGAIIAWHDERNGSNNIDIYAQRINAAGVVQWTANGAVICAASNGQYNPQIIADGANGAIVLWEDVRNGNNDVYTQRINASGVAQWTINGVPTCNANSIQYSSDIIADGFGGVILAWADSRNANQYDVYAQNINGSGILGATCSDPTVPSLSASSTNNCGVQNTTLSVTAGSLNNATAWKWYSGSCGGALAGTGNSIVVAPAVTTTYFARGEGGCVTPGACASVTITVGGTNVTPVITGNLTPCIGSSTTLSTGVYNSYLWSTGATTQAITVTANAVYKVTVTNAGGCTGSTSAKVIKKARPSFTLNTVDTNLCPPVTSVVLSLIGNAASYTWSPATGLNQTTGATVIASPTVTTSYFVTATGTNGCTLSGNANVNIKPKPLLLTTTAITASSATLNWKKIDCAIGYTIQYRLLGGTWLSVQVTTNIGSKVLTGLQASSSYQWRIKSKYANGTTSTYTNSVTFSTPASRLGETVTVNALQVYPNPATDKLNLEFPFTEGDATLTIVNALGQTVLTQKVSNAEGILVINIENLIEGIYIVDVKNGDNVFSSRFVKK